VEAPAVHRSGAGHVGARGRCPVQAELVRPIGHQSERKGTSCSRRSCTPSERWQCWRWPWVRASSPTKHTSETSRPSRPSVPTDPREGLAAFPRDPRPCERPTPIRVSAYRPSNPSADAGTAREPRHSLNTKQEHETQGGVRMRAKLSGWKHLLYTAAALATLALAAGARYKPR